VTNTAIPDPQIFYRERIPAQWNRMLDEQEQLGEEGREVFDGMKAVNATIRVDILDSASSYFLNISDGCMVAGEEATYPPFLTLRQNRAAYERLAAEAGDSAMAMLGGLTGLAGDMRLTQQRVDNLADVKGLLKLVIRGDNGFELLTHFGTGPIPNEPAASITVDEEAYRELRSGALDPQEAFMDGRIAIEGDTQIALQLALAAALPD
jgi:putative sterol carrier protein